MLFKEEPGYETNDTNVSQIVGCFHRLLLPRLWFSGDPNLDSHMLTSAGATAPLADASATGRSA